MRLIVKLPRVRRCRCHSTLSLTPSCPLTGPTQLSPSCFQLQTSGLPQNGHFPWATLDAGGAANKNEGNLFACPVGLGDIPSCTQCQLNPDAALRQPLNLAFTPRPLSPLLLCSHSPLHSSLGCLDKCLKIKLQKYFNILWQHAGAPTEPPSQPRRAT